MTCVAVVASVAVFPVPWPSQISAVRTAIMALLITVAETPPTKRTSRFTILHRWLRYQDRSRSEQVIGASSESLERATGGVPILAFT